MATSTSSEKLRTILVSSATAVALSAGSELVKVGGIISGVVNDREVVSSIPA